MRVLLDTHVLIWALSEPRKLTKAASAIIQAPENDVLFSAASIWEIAIKSRLGRFSTPLAAEKIAAAALETGFIELPVRAAAAARVEQLPLHHRDPFDRLLIAQTLSEPAILLTSDATLQRYTDLVTLL